MNQRFEKVRDALGGIFFMAGMTIFLVNVIMRYIFNNALIWGNEVGIFLLIWGSLIGWSIAAKDDRHIRVDLLWDFMPMPIKWGMDVFADIITICFCAFLIYAGYQNVAGYFHASIRSTNSGFMLWPVMLILPVSGIFLGLVYVGNLLRKIQSDQLFGKGYTPDPGKIHTDI
jgi:C4-dicarboxylate transporter DctQ subunit